MREARRPDSGPSPGAAHPRRARVLAIDDEPFVLRALGRILEAHDLTPLASARDALARLDAGERFDAILCDLMMPDMTGMEFFDHLGRRHPEQARRVVFLSGGAFTQAGIEFERSAGRTILGKPFDLAALHGAIAGALRQTD